MFLLLFCFFFILSRCQQRSFRCNRISLKSLTFCRVVCALFQLIPKNTIHYTGVSVYVFIFQLKADACELKSERWKGDTNNIYVKHLDVFSSSLKIYTSWPNERKRTILLLLSLSQSSCWSAVARGYEKKNNREHRILFPYYIRLVVFVCHTCSLFSYCFFVSFVPKSV